MAKKPIKSIELLPEYLRTDKNSKFLTSTIDQLIQPPKLERLDGFIGSKLTPTYVSTSDVYIPESLQLRRDYQLEPALIIKDELARPEQAKAIDDLANEIVTEGGFNNDFDRLFRSDFYSYDPQIDFDKLINYQKYYWLPTGPQTITITGKQVNSTSTYTVVDNEIKTAWILSPDGLTEDPTIVLYRGNTYNFYVNSEYKFYIKTSPSLGLTDVYNVGVTGNGAKNGLITLTVSENTPTTLYYTSDNVNFVQGKIVIKQATEDAYVNVDEEIVGKQNYTSGTGLKLSNGMKINFGGEVFPDTYKNKEYFVEGVGKAIRLIDYSLLRGSEKLAAQYDDDFDATNFDEFPFDTFQQLPINPEYLTINRGSRDLNPWSRYNRWVHEDIIVTAARENSTEAVIPTSSRAQRPIIEFVSDLQLYNFGSVGIRNVDLIDNETLDAFSTVEGSAGYYVDGVLLQQGNRIIFNADTDDLVRGKIYEVNYLVIDGIPRVELKKTDDHVPMFGSSVSVNLGNQNKGKSWWYNGDVWTFAQQHEKLNEAPLFDAFDQNGISYSSSAYDTDFKGTKIFSYEIGSGQSDAVLGFPLSYQSTRTIGSFKFKNYFNTDVISIFENNQVRKVTTALTYLRINKSTNPVYKNVWTATVDYEIPILQLFSTTEPTLSVELNAIDNPDVTDFNLQVFIDGVKLADSQWYLTKYSRKCFVNFYDYIGSGKNVLFKIFTRALANNNGQYETPIGLTNNPLNGPIETLTLTEISDHFKTMTERDPAFEGFSYGSNNSRDLPDIAQYGTRLVANSNPIAFANFFLGIKEHDAVDAIQKSADQYNQFKQTLFKKIAEVGNINDPVLALDNVMTDLNFSKDLNSPWYYSDMLAYGTDKNLRSWTITDIRNRIYPIADDFDPSKISLRSVLVYLNNVQLVLGTDYKFLVGESNIELLCNISVGDELRIEDHFSTEGCYVPSTPSKLGLYPKFEPAVYIDNTYIEPVKVIQGHDGSITRAFDDFRDDIILEYEKRVFNNIKTEYRAELFDINSVIPGAFRQNDYTLFEVNTILQSDFVRWAGFYNVDFQPNKTFDLAETRTWNYEGGLNQDTDIAVSGYWRSFFTYFYDTDRPHTNPWEMLGFSQKPVWWEYEYGPAPYTSGNSILWQDLEQGVIRQGERQGVDDKYVRTGLNNILPVDQFGNLVDPASLIVNTSPYTIRQNWKFGDYSPAETAWRRSSYWPFAVQRLLALTKSSSYCSLLYDTSRMQKNLAGQWTYGDNFELLDLRKVVLHGYNGQLASGYGVYVCEVGNQRNAKYLDQLQKDLTYLDFNLFHKVGGFVSKNKIQIIIDAIEPDSTSPGALLPQESYNLILNVSNPIKTARVSGIIVQKSNGKFVVKGYDNYKPYFTVFRPLRNSLTPTLTVGGVSENYVVWTASQSGGDTGLSSEDTTTAQSAVAGNFYQQGQIVLYNQTFYRTKVSHRAGATFNPAYFQSISSLPIVGGVKVQIANNYETIAIQIPYGTEYDKIQDVYDLIIGYAKWLTSEGFIFDEYNTDLNELMDWNLSAKEFLYWTTQNWAENSIITLSPFANGIKFSLPNSVVDNIFDTYYDYSVLKADGLPFPPKNLNVGRIDGVCTVETVSTNEGIYYLELNAVQKEHGMIFDNTTVFNDTIYDVETGYRQRRMKLIGFRTGQWDGDYTSPGFIYDNVKIQDWSRYTVYVYGDVVRYNGNYYSAVRNVPATTEFNFDDWVLLNEKPSSDLIPNFEYKINQFEDFYSLDIDNFDDAQQKMAQHLIGYTPRVYLNNVFTNPISQYKFYQGFIKEKGTKNAVRRLAKASIFNLQGETTFTEEWAFRVGQYGAYTSYQELETYLEEGTFIENPQIINYVDTKPVNPIDLIYYSTASNISIKPDDYQASETFVTTSTNILKLPTAGYISFEDITATAYNENSLLDIANSNQLNNGDVIWLGFKSNGSWDVLRYDLSPARITGVFVSSPGVDITFVTDYFHNLKIGEVVSVTRFNEQVNGVYIVKDIPRLNQFTVSSELPTIVNEELLSPGLLYKFTSARSASYDTLPPDAELLTTPNGAKFWIDNQQADGSYNWQVFEKIDNYSDYRISTGFNVDNQQFGYAIAKKSNSDVYLVGAPQFDSGFAKGRVFVYRKNGADSTRIFSYSLNGQSQTRNQYYDSTSTSEFGLALDYSEQTFNATGFGLFYTGAPFVGNVITSGTNLKYALDFTNYTTASLYISTSTQAGAVKISSVNPVTVSETPELVLLSPNYSNYERFGAALVVHGDTNNLYIGAPGTKNTGTGAVYIYQTLPPSASTTAVLTATSGTNLIYINSTASIKVGQTVWVPGVFDDILVGTKVETIYDDGVTQYVTLDQTIPAAIAADRKIRFYSTTSLITSYGVFTTTNGLFISFAGTVTSTTPSVGDEYGYALAASKSGLIGVFAAPGGDYVETFINPGAGVIRAVHTSTFGSDVRFGESVAISSGGDWMFVGAPKVKNSDDSFGKVAVYKRTGNTFTYYTSISNPVPGAAMNFGQKIAIDETTSTLAISAIGLNTTVPVQFDNQDTNFDSSSTVFFDTIENFGTVYIYNKIQEANRFVLASELAPPINVDLVGTNFGFGLAVDNDSVFVGAPAIDSVSTASVYQFTKLDSTKNSINLYKSYGELVDIDTVQKIRLIDTFDETVLEYLDVIDPIKGKISGLADQEIKYKSAYDPAIYSIGTAGVVVDADTSWLDNHVGELWWDLSTVKYVWYEQGDLTYRKNNWGTIFPGATIDVYEWVRTNYLPSEWSAIADTSAGLTESISGQPKYVDNSAIAVKQVYNSVSNSFNNVYYYWVKNKVTIPAVKNRRISSYQVASIIADPTGYGLRYAGLLSKDAIALANVSPLLVDTRIHLNVAKDDIKNTVPKHTEWVLLEENSANSMPPALYEKKLFDSLLGRDSLGNLVPDPSLTERTRYGVGIRPRQTLFKNRREALRSLVEFANEILLENQITGSYSFRNLNAQQLPPDQFSREYDQIVEDNEGLNLIDTRLLQQAVLTCTVLNGKIRSVNIVNAGLGYKLPPLVEITGPSSGAVVETEIDSAGRVIAATIKEAGTNFAEAPLLTVRPFTVIVLADNLYNNKWTKFEWNKATNQWERKETQKYNTPLYWKYVDWKSSTYNQFISYTSTVDQVYQLDTLEELIPGQYVKVKNSGDGRFIVVEKAAEGQVGTFGRGFNLVYSQNGTIQILDTIWDLRNSTLGFDQNNTYDQTLYDQGPDLELNYILTALKEDIFINELKINWNLFFFKAVKYALTEQKLLDWAFKTSFINVTNFAGVLDQRPVYKLQTSQNYEDYIKEVKPYHSQIRSFTANHQIIEPSNSFFTDFDLPSYYNDNTNKFEVVDTDSILLNQQPWKAWGDNYLYTVGEIVVGNGGAGYTYPPQVTIETAPGDTGGGAVGKAYISSGKVSKIEVIKPGSGYKVAPRVILTGGGDANLIPAVAYAQLLNGKVRNNKIGIKFDRNTRTSTLDNSKKIDAFVCNGSVSEFVLTWYADPDKTKITVTLDGELVLSSNYKVENYKELSNGYNKKFTRIVFTEFAPSFGQVLEVTYSTNIELFNAVDRIIEYYTATSELPGKELPQLMTGIEYPGVSVQGLSFDYTSEWDISYSPFGQGSYADGVSFYNQMQIVESASAGTDTVTVSTTTGITVGQISNIISASKSLTTSTIFSRQIGKPNFDVKVVGVNTATRQVKFNSTISQSLISTSTVIYVDGSATTVVSTATLEVWSYNANSSLLDTSIVGGAWSTLTNSRVGALGINPEEIIIDGDGFITPNTSYAPEELVPGETHDTIGINVYTRYNEGAPTIYNGVIDVYANTITTASLIFVPPNTASIFVTYGNKNFSYTDNPALITATNVGLYTYDWINNKITVGPQTLQGKLGYTVVSIGGGRPNAEAGVIDRGFAVSEIGSSEAEVTSISTTATVRSAYVTVDGQSIPKLTTANTSTLGYMLVTSSLYPKKAAAHVYNLSTTTNSSVQAWFFGTANKFWNEFKEQIFDVGLDLQQEFIVEQAPGIIEPAAANIIVEKDIGDGRGFIRLQPPFISYYKVDPNVLIYKIDNNIQRTGLVFTDTGVRVYLNGVQLIPGADYSFNYAGQTVQIRGGILNQNDVLAVLGLPTTGPFAEYDITGNTLVLRDPIQNARLRVITFTNHDDLAVRTESFVGDLNRRFKVSRPIYNNNFVWVTVNGILLVNKYDYTVLEDGRTVELSDRWHTDATDTIVITTITSDKLVETVVGYRIFNDIFNRTHYKRLSKQNTTVLSRSLSFTDTEIHVVDSTVLTPPLVSKKIPGIVLIDGERIEFNRIDGNVLTQLRRATLGTSPSYYLPAGTKVLDQSIDQTVPYSDKHARQVIYTISNSSTYNISTASTVAFNTATDISGQIQYFNTQTSDGIILNPLVEAKDQITVSYGGRILRKHGVYVQDTSIAYDSPDINFSNILSTASISQLPTTDIKGTAYRVTSTNQVWVYTNSLERDSVNGYVYKGLNYLEPEFTINTSTNQIILNIDGGVKSNIKLVLYKKYFDKNDIWNDQVTDLVTVSLLESTTLQARFLQEKPAELPDNYYFGGTPPLDLDNGLVLTDENNAPLEGL